MHGHGIILIERFSRTVSPTCVQIKHQIRQKQTYVRVPGKLENKKMSNLSSCPASRPRRAIRMPGRGTNGDFEYYYYSPSSEFQDEQVEDMSVQETENIITNGGDVILNGQPWSSFLYFLFFLYWNDFGL